LINKKYTLPYLAVDALYEHFAAFQGIDGPLPLIWHQCLLTFAQRYKADLTLEQKQGLRELLSKHSHYAITPEVKREINSVGCRGDAPSMVPSAGTSGSASSSSAAAKPAAATMAAGSSNSSAALAGPAAIILASASAVTGADKKAAASTAAVAGKKGSKKGSSGGGGAGKSGGMDIDF
jgi:Bystin